jgi:protein involved in polysaccharide export with SLBB domain
MSRTLTPLFRVLALPAMMLALAGCSLPKVSIPFVGGEKPAPVDDISVPYTVTQTLGYGHTLELSVYAGMRSPSRIYRGTVVVDQQGVIDLGKYGTVKVGGLKADRAIKAINSAITKKVSQSIINVHLERIEDVPLVNIIGAVERPGVVQWFDDAEVVSLLPYVGGRTAGVKGTAVYITHEGIRHFRGSELSEDTSLKPGDIVELSSDL